MQPYLFPYLGYFQMAAAVDQFWSLDCVQFIRRGWINRNRLREGDEARLFSVPVTAGPQTRRIHEVELTTEAPHAFARLERRLTHSAAGAPYLDRARALVAWHGTLAREERALSRFLLRSLGHVFQMLSVPATLHSSTSLGLSENYSGQDRIVELSQRVGARSYINAPGGAHLYDPQHFARAGLRLGLFQPDLRPYGTGRRPFLPGLSILDFIAHVAPQEYAAHLSRGHVRWVE